MKKHRTAGSSVCLYQNQSQYSIIVPQTGNLFATAAKGQNIVVPFNRLKSSMENVWHNEVCAVCVHECMSPFTLSALTVNL